MDNSAIFRRLPLVLIALTVGAATAFAQPVPDEGQVAAGAELGIFFPTDERLDNGIMGGGLIEFYATPRVGIRGSVMAMRNTHLANDDIEERQLRIGGDVIYNWEYGAVHPFLGGGIGIHFLRSYVNDDNVGDNDTKFGAQILGGVEYFLNRAWTIKGEGRYQWVADRPQGNPDGFAVTAGIKRYF